MTEPIEAEVRELIEWLMKFTMQWGNAADWKHAQLIIRRLNNVPKDNQVPRS